MTTRHAIELDTVLFLIASIAIGMVFAWRFNYKPDIRTSFSLPAIGVFENQTAKTILTPTPKVEALTQISPDGTKTLTMLVTTNKDMTKSYTIDPVKYSATLLEPENMSVPFNAWSPDNAYVFVEREDASGSGALVMKATGEPFATGEPYFDVAALFAAKNTGNAYYETTGWASETLLIVNTTAKDGSKGPSYWFEVPSKAIIRLSSEF